VNFYINSESSGKYKIEAKGGRRFLVTDMLPIQADSVMNGLLYPANSVAESYQQLDNIPVPSGHPSFDGKSLKASEPLASKHNIGAFVRKPVLNGRNVYAELVIDVEVANRTREGKEAMRRIRKKRRIGVSTGLNANIMESKGTHNGDAYYGIVNNIKFDHVALLLKERPAGQNTYTLNSGELFNLKKGETSMREITIDTSNLSLEDHKFLELRSADAVDIVNALKHETSEAEAIEVLENSGKLVVNSAEYADFNQNRELLAEFNAEKAAARKEKTDFIIANSKMEQSDLDNLPDKTIDSLVNSIKPKNTHIINGRVSDPVFVPLEDA